ncbi:MAG: ThuA domain-containing protein [Treponema sp.]|nr:ThuA domain-containing protein [Treponema sp.]
MNDLIQAAVLVENHVYDIISFQKMLDTFTDCNCYVQPVDLFVRDIDDNMGKYDTVLWYNINWNPPAPDGELQNYLDNKIGTTGQGIVFIHHALLNFQNLDVYTKICGLRQRGWLSEIKYTQNETVRQLIINHEHPITHSVPDFTIIDETYNIGEPEEPGNEILIATDNEKSMKKIAWTRQYGNSRVFAYASGHDNKAYANVNFRKIVHQALRWSACRI